MLQQTTNIGDIKAQIFEIQIMLKNVMRLCELLNAGAIGEQVSKGFACLTCMDTGNYFMYGSGWTDASCPACK